jgi:phospholipase C
VIAIADGKSRSKRTVEGDVLLFVVAHASLSNIKHVVLLMQENRSFDHYFGTMSGVIGYSDPNAIKLPNGRSVFYQPTDTTPEGYLLPFHLSTRKTSAQYILSTGHGWAVQHGSWNGGKVPR